MTPPEIRQFEGKLMSGLRRVMSFTDDRTSELWREFRAREKNIANRVGINSYSIKVYRPDYSFSRFDPESSFEKWAAIEAIQPDGEFETLEIPSGLYAVFVHRGPASTAAASFGYVFGTWIPNSGFDIDDRPHFEILPAGYDPFDVNAQEEIWVPISHK